MKLGCCRRQELGWSAQWRKDALRLHDPIARTRRWREYCCESFCDTAAWRYCGVCEHDEFTLSKRHREARRRWFAEVFGTAAIKV